MKMAQLLSSPVATTIMGFAWQSKRWLLSPKDFSELIGFNKSMILWVVKLKSNERHGPQGYMRVLRKNLFCTVSDYCTVLEMLKGHSCFATITLCMHNKIL